MNVRPTYDRVVVRKAEEEKVSKGGIIFPENARNPTQMGTVVAVGPGRNIDAPGGYLVRIDNPEIVPAAAMAMGVSSQIVAHVDVQRPRMQVKVNDTVLWGKHAGSEVKVGEETLYILREDEILAVAEEDAKTEAAPAA